MIPVMLHLIPPSLLLLYLPRADGDNRCGAENLELNPDVSALRSAFRSERRARFNTGPIPQTHYTMR
jgi:hypothetical protein